MNNNDVTVRHIGGNQYIIAFTKDGVNYGFIVAIAVRQPDGEFLFYHKDDMDNPINEHLGARVLSVLRTQAEQQYNKMVSLVEETEALLDK